MKTADKNLQPLLDDIRELFYNATTSIHKARNEIKIITYKENEYIVKSFKIPHFLNKIVYTFFRESKAKKSYKNSIKISKFTPKPIGYKHYKKWGLLHQSYYVSERFDYDFTIREPLLDKEFKDKKMIFREFALFSFKLHNDGIFHKDYSPGNILIKKEQTSYVFKIVDINRMVFKTLSIDERVKNFAQLWASDEDLTTIIKEYAKLIDEDEGGLVEKALFYSQKHKERKNLKKKFKKALA